MTVYLTEAFNLAMMAKDAKFPLTIKELSEENFKQELSSATKVTGHGKESNRMGVVLAMTETDTDTIEKGDVVLCAIQQSGTYRYFMATT